MLSLIVVQVVVQVLGEVATGVVPVGSGCLRQPRTEMTTDAHRHLDLRDLVKKPP